MSRRMTKEEALAYKNRWQIVNEAEIEELRKTPITQKLRQLASLMASARLFRWPDALADEEQVVWDRWSRLRRAYHGCIESSGTTPDNLA